MPTFRFDHPWTWYLMWNAVAFAGAFVVNSFVEWLSHKFILHSNKIVSFAYELHDRQHHVYFNGTDSYHAVNEDVKKHVKFVPRDYCMFLLATTPIWAFAEVLSQRALLVGGVLSTLVALQMFNSFHWRFHVPSDTWFQRTWFFRFIKNHHRLHHADTHSNYNVHFFPLADWVLGTLKRD
jgi:hypothetical protein